MKKLIITILLTSLSISTVNAAGTCIANACTANLTQLFIHENTSVYLKVNADMTVLDCVTPSGGGIVLKQDNPLQKELYSALLSAYMNQSVIKVRSAVRTDPGSTNDQVCELMYIVMNTGY